MNKRIKQLETADDLICILIYNRCAPFFYLKLVYKQNKKEQTQENEQKRLEIRIKECNVCDLLGRRGEGEGRAEWQRCCVLVVDAVEEAADVVDLLAQLSVDDVDRLRLLTRRSA